VQLSPLNRRHYSRRSRIKGPAQGMETKNSDDCSTMARGRGWGLFLPYSSARLLPVRGCIGADVNRIGPWGQRGVATHVAR
jgi:hypothetical protein